MRFLDILKNKDMRKIFGKREIKIIEKQLHGVSLKPSEKTRLSRDIRRKFKAVKLLIPFSEKFDLKHSEIIRNLIDEAKEEIMRSKYFPRIKRIVLFGSSVENKLTLLSDIDIAVEFSKISKAEALKFRLKVSRHLDDKLDIQVYNILSAKIKKEIDKNGRKLYEKKN